MMGLLRFGLIPMRSSLSLSVSGLFSSSVCLSGFFLGKRRAKEILSVSWCCHAKRMCLGFAPFSTCTNLE